MPLGIDKVRLTGGEPLVRRDLPKLVEKLVAIPGLEDVGLTTNGILLAPVVRDAPRRRAEADQHQPRHAGPGSVRATDAAAGGRAGDRRDSGGQGAPVSIR